MYQKPLCYAYTLLLCLLLLFAGVSTYAVSRVEDYSVGHYTNENGLPQNSVKAIARDEYGFLWLATEAGLCRFDGKRFYLFNKFNAGILSSRIVDIWRSPVTGGLHALTEKWSMLVISKGNVRIEHQRWEDLYLRVSPYTASAATVHTTWRYHSWSDPYRMDSLQLTMPDRQTLLLQFNGTVQWFRGGKLYATQRTAPMREFNVVFTIGQSLYRLDQQPGANTAMEIRPEKLREVLLLGDIVKQEGKAERFLCVNQAAGQVFIYSDKQFYLVERRPDGNLHTTLLLDGFDFEKQKIAAGYYDARHKRIFLGSHTNGLYTFSPRLFQSRIHGNAGDADNVFYDLIPYSDSSVITGKSVLFYTGSTGVKLLPAITVSSSVIGSMLYRSADSTIWTADVHYVYRFTKDALHMISKWPVIGATAITQVATGDMWIGTNKQGIYTIHPEHPEWPARLLYKNRDYIDCLLQEEPGRVWIGTENRLMRAQISDGKLDTLRQLDDKVVRSVYISGPGEVWLCTYEDGLYLYRNKRLIKFPSDRNGSMNTVHYIMEDKKGFFWISTNNGIFQVAKSDLLRYVEDRTNIPFYLHYTKKNGFYTNEFNGGGQQVGAKLNNGYFAFASMDGIVFFNPDDIQAELPDAPIVIDNMELDGRKIQMTDTLNLNYDFANLRIRVATPYFGNPENVVLEYQLDNGSWSALENETFAFNALEAGEHRLIIRKRAGFGGRNNYKSILLRIQPPFYDTGIFRVLCVVVIAVLIWLFLKVRLGILNRRNQYLEQIVADRTYDLKEIIHALEISERKLGNELQFQEKLNKNIAHDIRTPLKYLVLFAKYLQGKIERAEMPAVDEVQSIHVSAEWIYNYTDKLTVYLKARMEKDHSRAMVNLHELVRQNEAFFMLALREQNSTIVNELSPGLAINTHQQLFEILMHNLIDNAIKNTSNGIITISSAVEAGYLMIVVRDNGKGMTAYEAEVYNRYFSNHENPEQERYTGLGFSIIKDILPLLEITIEVRAGNGAGTAFWLRMLSEKRQQELDK